MYAIIMRVVLLTLDSYYIDSMTLYRFGKGYCHIGTIVL